jgi:group II intron reverse transcriptase/maturase
MTHEPKKSDLAKVATRPTNNAGLKTAAESVERRVGTKENVDQQSTHRTQIRERVSQALGRVRQAAKERRKEKFTALLHHVDVDLLRLSFQALKRKAAPGVDGVTWQDYEVDLESKLLDLHARVHRGAYRAQPSRRKYILKSDGRQRPLGIASVEDKILQRAVLTVLNSIYEEDFLGFSYGFRPNRSQHDALDALIVGIERKKVSWILDLDIRDFFGTVNHDWLIRFLEHRIGDERILRLIRKWLKAGVLEEGVVRESEQGSPQGATISPLLANVYLHYALDLWAQQWRQRHATGDMIIVRYADDCVLGFEHEAEAKRFLEDMRLRLAEFSLSLHPDKTKLIEFGRFAAERRGQRGQDKPETFTFLGFVLICGKASSGRFLVLRKNATRPHAGYAQAGQRGTAMANASANSRAGTLAAASCNGILRVPRSAYKYAGTIGVPPPRFGPLEASAFATQSESTYAVATDAATRQRLATAQPYPASLAQSTF